MSCPRIVVAGTNSGAGKTSVALALVSALRARGLKVQSFKVGPDFLDPSFHAIASGRPCYNLDPWMMGKEYILHLFHKATAGADIAVIEGVMGLFDGAEPSSSVGSTADLARILSAPVLLVVDASGMGRSIAAMVKGYAELEPSVSIAGVVANRTGSEKHAAILSEALASCNLPPLFGAVPKAAFPAIPRRHLGLVKADSSSLPQEILGQFASVLESAVSVPAIISAAQSAPALPASSLQTDVLRGKRKVRIGLASDAAFNFYYQDTLDVMESAGSEFARFSPVNDASLPDGLDALMIGGGYPEEFAEELSANQNMLHAVRRFAESGRPVYAECGGLMYLSQGVELADGARHSFAGILPAWTKMNRKFTALGYADVILKEDTLVGGAGAQLKGHRFHYSSLDSHPEEAGWRTVYSVAGHKGGKIADEGYQRGNVLASYVHLHLASRPGSIEHFTSKCAGES
ncbi:MAG: cobyrinate a,c-diamide synthase [Nitrospinae bacterium]|nr:cobyrinate a,c-diamide synthase [Nitrospinota bacterium]